MGVNISRLPYPFLCLPRLFANCLPRPAHILLTSLRRYIKLDCLILLMTGNEFQCKRRNFEAFLKPNFLFVRTLDRFRLRAETSKTTSKWRKKGVLWPFMDVQRHLFAILTLSFIRHSKSKSV